LMFSFRISHLIVLFFAALLLPVFCVAQEKTASTTPITLSIEPNKRIFSSHEGLMVKFTLKAKERAKVCIEKDSLSQFKLQISRSGEQMPLQPLVVKDNRELFRQHMKVRWLDAGQTLTFLWAVPANARHVLRPGGG
jgi:hypothetical protein